MITICFDFNLKHFLSVNEKIQRTNYAFMFSSRIQSGI